MFNWADAVGIIVGISNLIGMIVVVVIGITKISTTTDGLTQSITNLNSALAKLENAIEKVEDRMINHGERIAALEK